jgi:hypothetical protein
MSSAESTRTPLRCHHCGREVAETMHTRSTYRVDYYALHTGDVEPTTMARSDDPADVVTVMRLVRAVELFTCVDCYRQERVRRERERLFRTELEARPDEGAAP